MPSDKSVSQRININSLLMAGMITLLSIQTIASDKPHTTQQAQQTESFFYLGAKLGINRYQHACQPWRINCDKQDVAGGLFAGYQLNENFAFEAAYLDLGEAVATYLETGLEQEYTGTMQGFELSALASLPLSENIAVFAKGGTFNWTGKNKSTAVTLKANGWSPMAGLGFTYQFAQSWQARLEYQYLHELGNETLGGSNGHLTTFAISYQFGQSKRQNHKKTALQQPEAVQVEDTSAPAVAPKPVVAAKPAVIAKPVELERIVLSILFAFDDSTLLDTSALEPVIARLVAHPETKVSLKGYTDSKGSDNYNLKLSKRRVDAVNNYLIKHKVKPEQINSQYFGKKSHLLDNLTAEHRHKNRRVLIILPKTSLTSNAAQATQPAQGVAQ